jgi:hypothetical protein
MSHAPRYRLNTGICSDIVLNLNDRTPYTKCPTLTNPTAGMATATNDTNISKKMRFAQRIRAGSALKGGKSFYSVNKTNTFGSWYGAPNGYGEPIRNAF